MTKIAAHLVPDFAPFADPNAVVQVPGMRITVLTSRLLRIEYSPENKFEDRPSQAFWFRSQSVPEFTVHDQGVDNQLVVETAALRLKYTLGTAPAPETLSIALKQLESTWYFGDPEDENLMGTYRTLDTIDGSVALEKGLLSRAGWSVVDDSASLVFTEPGWLTNREAPAGQLDLYFFGYGRDYHGALGAFRKVAGPVPLLPRWSLGNWWSRYWAYTDAELRQLINDFKQYQIPLSVCIIDMDWHITDTGNDSSGWTGYTWNRELFPDPQAIIEFIHANGLKTALNLHPAEGIHPHEAVYAEFSKWMQADPAGGEPIQFDLADSHFAKAYFELLHHPEEERGIDFWWIDWQQGVLSGLPGLDPLWWLNHLHFYDLARPLKDGQPSKRPFIFSRWGGLGNHRYPIGFSGDTKITWDSLAFQPVFTSTAANVGYGWWSHDIGGHYGGIKDPELYTRWVQYGVLSPILRLHSTKNPQLERRPFGWDSETLRRSRQAMQFRHRLIPYLYTMSWRDHAFAEAPIRPMYHDHPDAEEAYFCPDQYTFGTELIASPYLSPRDPETGLSRQVVWLPEGGWHFFSGDYLAAGWHALHGDMDDIPLFARPGGIIPLCDPEDWRAPDTLEVHVFPGRNNQFQLYDDDGETNQYLQAEYELTDFALDWAEDRIRFTIDSVNRPRTFVLKFRSVTIADDLQVTDGGKTIEVDSIYDPALQTLTVGPIQTNSPGQLLIDIKAGQYRADPTAVKLAALRKIVESLRVDNAAMQVLVDSLPEIVANPVRLAAFRSALNTAQMTALLEVLMNAGINFVTHATEPKLMIWNNSNNPEIRFELSTDHYGWWLAQDRFQLTHGEVPAFKGWATDRDLRETNWLMRLNYGNLHINSVRGKSS